jgi:hypothetical protein
MVPSYHVRSNEMPVAMLGLMGLNGKVRSVPETKMVDTIPPGLQKTKIPVAALVKGKKS